MQALDSDAAFQGLPRPSSQSIDHLVILYFIAREKTVNTYINRLNATFAIAGLLMMAPFMAMARLPAPSAVPHGESLAKKRTSNRVADEERRASKPSESEPVS